MMHGEQEASAPRAQLEGWLHTEFVPWEKQEEKTDKSITTSDVQNLGGPCKVVLRCSSYMNHKFEMTMMSHAMVHDDSVTNLALDITEEEQERCTKFLTALNGKASYSYFDAMVLMPMAPKPYDSPGSANSGKKLMSTIFNVLAEDEDSVDPDKIKKVFCSQSVVLMLRYALDPNGRHSGLLQALSTVNSRLVSPRQVQHILEAYGATPLSNEELAKL